MVVFCYGGPSKLIHMFWAKNFFKSKFSINFSFRDITDSELRKKYLLIKLHITIISSS